jgi:hypothetical protein
MNFYLQVIFYSNKPQQKPMMMKKNRLFYAVMIPVLSLMLSGGNLSAQEQAGTKKCQAHEQDGKKKCNAQDQSGTKKCQAHEQEGMKKCQTQGQQHDGSCCKNGQNAEPKGPFMNFVNIPGINDKQKEDISKLRIDLLKSIGGIKDQIMEKEARLRTLTHNDQPDTQAIDKLIDEIASLEANLRKNVEKARQQIRALLNEEQKLWFDAHCFGPCGAKGPQKEEGCKKNKGH